MLAPSSLTGLVLAGGQSRRMGQDKALLQWQGEALLSLTAKRALTVCDRVWVITPWPERYAALLPQDCELLSETGVPQGERSPGPLVALGLGLAAVETEWALLLACDLPCLLEEELSVAVRQLSDLGEEVDAYLARSPELDQAQLDQAQSFIWEPLCGFYRRRCLASLEQCLERGERSLQRWLNRLNVEPLMGWSPEALLNCNRPEDWTLAQKILARRSSQSAVVRSRKCERKGMGDSGNAGEDLRLITSPGSNGEL